MVDDDPYKYFRIEAREILDEIGRGLLTLEKGAGGPDLVKQLLRGAHTLKGAARVVKLKEIAELTHAIEDALQPFRETATGVPRDRIDQAFRLADDIAARIAALPGSAEQTKEQQKHATGAQRKPQATSADEPLRQLRADADELDAIVDGVSEAHAQLAALKRGLGDLHRVRDLVDLLKAQLRPRPGSQEPLQQRQQLLARSESSAGGSPARNTTSDAAAAIADELSAVVARVERTSEVTAEQLDLELRQLRAAAERVRLVPVHLIFTVLERTARDAAQSLGKSVTFKSSGGEARLDAQVLTVIQSALMQVVRNAVAHGIEGELDRAAAGKPPAGQVVVDVKRAGPLLVFTCTDDGRGVDVASVKKLAEGRGVSATDDLTKLLLAGGVSTSPNVTGVAGRGIGFDVIRDAVVRLRGNVAVRTERAKGTTIEIKVPVSLAALDALTVEAGGQRALIPVSAVRTTLRLAESDVARTADGDSILLDNAVVPFAPLGRALGTASQGSQAAHASHAPGRPSIEARTRSPSLSAVVVDAGGVLAAVGVDRLLGTRNSVVRALPSLTPADAIVAGACLDADGDPQVVLDPQALVARVRTAKRGRADVAPRRAPILVVDDSLTTRMLEQSILESAGYEVELAVSGEEAIKLARQKTYSLFLVDVEMPGMSGFDFVALLRADAGLRALPAILITSRGSPEDKQRGVDVGASAYIVKSEFDQTELLSLIKRLAGV